MTQQNSSNDNAPELLLTDHWVPGNQALLKELFTQKLFSDLKLKVGDKRLPVHKAILCINSPYFRNMLTAETSDKYKDEIELKDVDIVGVKLVLSYMYSGKLDLTTNDNAHKVISVANYFLMDSLKNKCSEVLLNAIAPSTASKQLFFTVVKI